MRVITYRVQDIEKTIVFLSNLFIVISFIWGDAGYGLFSSRLISFETQLDSILSPFR